MLTHAHDALCRSTACRRLCEICPRRRRCTKVCAAGSPLSGPLWARPANSALKSERAYSLVHLLAQVCLNPGHPPLQVDKTLSLCAFQKGRFNACLKPES